VGLVLDNYAVKNFGADKPHEEIIEGIYHWLMVKK
jgi:hypothetical protein